MFTKLILGAALALTVGLSGGVWALANKKADNCCFPGSDCCYPGSPCCDDCCYPGSTCCYPGSPCCGDSPKATPASAGAEQADCCPDPTCCGDKANAASKPTSATKCDSGKCRADSCKGD